MARKSKQKVCPQSPGSTGSVKRLDKVAEYQKWIVTEHGQKVMALTQIGRGGEALWLAFKEGCDVAGASQNGADEQPAPARKD